MVSPLVSDLWQCIHRNFNIYLDKSNDLREWIGTIIGEGKYEDNNY